MNVAVQSEFTGAGQMAFFAGLDAANRAHGGRFRFLPLREPLESAFGESLISKGLDAYVGSIMSDRWLSEVVSEKQIWVNLGQLSEILSVPTIGVDYRALGRLAAETFLESGVTHLYLCIPRGQWRSQELEAGVRAIEIDDQVGMAVEIVGPERLSILRCLSNINTTQKVGILAINDPLARKVIELAQGLRLEMGESLKVIGIGDDPEASMLSPIPVSSIQLPFYEIGRAVVACVVAQEQSSSKPSEQTRLLSPGEVVKRASLQTEANRDALVEKAMTWMERDLRKPRGIEHLARALGVSRRKLELAFSKSGMASPAREWMNFRLQEAKRQLRETDWRMQEIARRTGFASQQRFAQVFREHFGVSASQWRFEGR